MILSGLKRTKIIAKRFIKLYSLGCDRGNLIGAALEGLVLAAYGFDVEKGDKFGNSNYLRQRLIGVMQDELRKSDFLSREVRRKVKALQKYYDDSNMAKLSDEDAAKHLNISVKKLLRLKIYSNFYFNDISFAKNVEVDQHDLVDVIATKHGMVKLQNIIRNLPEPKREILVRYLDGESMVEIGSRFEVSGSRISQIFSELAMSIRDELQYSGIYGDLKELYLDGHFSKVAININ